MRKPRGLGDWALPGLKVACVSQHHGQRLPAGPRDVLAGTRLSTDSIPGGHLPVPTEPFHRPRLHPSPRLPTVPLFASREFLMGR